MFDPDKAARSAAAEPNDATMVAAPAAPIAPDEGELSYIPLSKLEFDPDNVRKSGGENIDALKALIASQGLLQNLIVCPLMKRGKPTGKFGVTGGGRRLRALRALAAEGRIAKDEEILCRIVPRERATLVSAAENSGREPMSSADTIVAFAAMVREGKGVEELALAFGVSALTVQRRLKLANVSPRLFDLYRQDEIDLDQLMALAVTDDHARQELIWDTTPDWQRHAVSLRRLALGEAVNAATDRLARFVGAQAYAAAGGAITRDLFADDDHGYFTDPALLQRLAVEKLDAERQRLLDSGLPWVDLIDNYGYSERQSYTQAPTTLRQATEEEQQAIDAAEATYQAAAQAFADFQSSDEEDEGDEERYSQLEDACNEAEAARDALIDRLRVTSHEVTHLCGAVLTLENNGRLAVHTHLVRKADAKKAAAATRATAPDTGTEFESNHAPDDDDAAKLSDALTRRLTAQKTVALQVQLAAHHHVALAVLAHSLLSALCIGPGYGALSNITARCRKPDLKLADPSIESAKAWGDLAALVAAAEAGMPEDLDALLPWLIEQSPEKLTQLLALCTALSVSLSGGLRRDGASTLTQAVGLDMADYWTATGDTYFRSVPKALIADAIAEVDPEAAKTVDKLKKAEAVALAEAKLAGTRWLPPLLRVKVAD